MTRSCKKLKELQIAQAYVFRLGLRGSFVEREAPDFIFHCDSGRKLGLEVTEYHRTACGPRSFTTKQIEVEQKKLQKRSYDYAKMRQRDSYLNASVRFKGGVLPPSSDHQALVEAIYRCADHFELNAKGKCVDVNIEESNELICIKYLDRLRIQHSNIYLDWDFGDSVMSTDCNEDELINLINKKSSKLQKGGLDEIHLVVMGFESGHSQYMGDTRPCVMNSQYEVNRLLVDAGFDMVAIVNPPESVAWTRESRRWKSI